MLATLVLTALPLSLAPAVERPLSPPAAGGSYSTLTPAAERRFYRTRAAHAVGKRLHVHVPAKTFLRPAEPVRPYRRRPVRYYAFRHRGVTFLVHPGNPYFRQFLRKARTNHVACLRGRVVRYRDPVGIAFVVHQMRAIEKRARGQRRAGRREPRASADYAARPAVRWIEKSRRNAMK